MNKKLTELAIITIIAGSTFTASAWAEAKDDILNNPNNKVYIDKIVNADNEKAKAEALGAVELASLVPQSISLTDPDATLAVRKLYTCLAALAKTDYTIFGHQNDAHHKMFRIDSGTNSDIKDITGSLSGVVGMDALSLTGSELELSAAEAADGVTLVKKAAAISVKAANEGAIITLSMHMPNFQIIKERGKAADGKYNYIGYSPNEFRGEVVKHILPDGDLNEVYTGYLDLVAEYAKILEAAGVPVIFRPFHEHNGSWFYWGADHCTDEEFIALFRYTVEYMRDTKNVHNFLYAISPNGQFKNEGDYFYRYPGNDYVDIFGFDTYDDNPRGGPKHDPWFRDFETSLQVVSRIAKLNRKIPAVTEIGVRLGGSLAVSGNQDKQWFSHVSELVRKYHVPYFMTWSNFEKLPHNFFAPYMVNDKRGHEMINDFNNFYNEESSIFADGVRFKEMPVPRVRNR